jgi:nitroreductase
MPGSSKKTALSILFTLIIPVKNLDFLETACYTTWTDPGVETSKPSFNYNNFHPIEIDLIQEKPTVNTLDAIAQRRSIRRFKPVPLPEDVLQTIIGAGIQAPSGKNKQPWRFIIVKEDQRPEMVRILREGIARAKADGEDPGSSEYTARIMEHAPVTVFVFNPDGLSPWLPHSIDQNISELVDTQSIGAAIQNMLLAAQDLGVGSLWICDVFYAYQALSDWLGEKGQMIAAVSFGYPAESPAARLRKSYSELVRIR